MELLFKGMRLHSNRAPILLACIEQLKFEEVTARANARIAGSLASVRSVPARGPFIEKEREHLEHAHRLSQSVDALREELSAIAHYEVEQIEGSRIVHAD